MSSDSQERKPFNFFPIYRVLALPAIAMGILMCANKPFNHHALDERVRAHDGLPGLSIEDVNTLSDYSGIDQTKLQSDYNMDGRLTYERYDQDKLRIASRKYSQQQ